MHEQPFPILPVATPSPQVPTVMCDPNKSSPTTTPTRHSPTYAKVIHLVNPSLPRPTSTLLLVSSDNGSSDTDSRNIELVTNLAETRIKEEEMETKTGNYYIGSAVYNLHYPSVPREVSDPLCNMQNLNLNANSDSDCKNSASHSHNDQNCSSFSGNNFFSATRQE